MADTLEAGVETAREKAAAMRGGTIGRDPNRGQVPDVVHATSRSAGSSARSRPMTRPAEGDETGERSA